MLLTTIKDVKKSKASNEALFFLLVPLGVEISTPLLVVKDKNSSGTIKRVEKSAKHKEILERIKPPRIMLVV